MIDSASEDIRPYRASSPRGPGEGQVGKGLRPCCLPAGMGSAIFLCSSWTEIPLKPVVRKLGVTAMSMFLLHGKRDRLVLFLFCLIGCLFLFWPSEELNYLNVTDLIFGDIAGGRPQLVSDYVSSRNIVNSPDSELLRDIVFHQTFPYAAIVGVRGCPKEVLYQDSQVAALAFCDIVFLTTVDCKIRHIVTRSFFLDQRERVIGDSAVPRKDPIRGELGDKTNE